MTDTPIEEDVEDADPSVPTELLELHLVLDESGVTAEEFKEVYGGTDSKS